MLFMGKLQLGHSFFRYLMNKNFFTFLCLVGKFLNIRNDPVRGLTWFWNLTIVYVNACMFRLLNGALYEVIKAIYIYFEKISSSSCAQNIII